MLIFLLLLLLGLASPACGSVDGKRKELEGLRQRIEQLKKEIEQASEDRAEVADALKQSEQRISDVNRSLRQLAGQLQSLTRELDELSVATQQTRADLVTQQEKLAQLLRAGHAHIGNDALRLLLSGRDPAEIARNLAYLRYVGLARQDMIRAYRTDLDRLQMLKVQIQEHRQQLDLARAEQLRQRQALEVEKRQRQALLDKLSDQIRAQRRQFNTLLRDEQRLARLIERLSQLAAKPSRPAQKTKTAVQQINVVADASLANYEFEKLKGRLALPLAGEILSRFGQPREGGGPAWKGLFIRAPQGREVRAVGNGRVVFADWLRGFGNLLILDHGNGYLSLYSNNESLYKQVGELVRAGDVIATVGNTGGQEEPGLYFELRRHGRPFDPLSWVKPDITG